MMDCIFGAEGMYDVEPPLIFASLPFRMSGYGPMQPNNIDCGVFVVRNMQLYGTNWANKVGCNF